MAAIKKLLKKSYTVKDVNALMTESLFRPVNGKTLGEKDAAKAIVKVAAQTGANVSPAVVKMAALKANPAPKRKTAARTQRAAEAYVRRPSQITKKAPSKRLKKRRTVNLQSPRGVFPNPSTRDAKTASILWRYNKTTGYWEAERSCIKNATCEQWLKVYKDDEPDEIFKVAAKKPSGLSAAEKAKFWGLKNNPDSVHFDIDVNSHNARGAKAKTRVNPVARKKIAGLKNFIVQESAFSDTTGFKTVAVFAKVDESFEYAKARDAKNRSEGKRRWIKVLEG